jgi:hypothetical protein
VKETPLTLRVRRGLAFGGVLAMAFMLFLAVGQAQPPYFVFLPFTAREGLPYNRPPEIPAAPSPVDGATDQSTDVYFEANNPSPGVLTCDDTPSTSCDPGILSYSTTYYWQVIATDARGASTSGPVWSLTTTAPPNQPPYPPAAPSPPDGAADQSDYVHLSWTGGDPDGDSVTYDVYLQASGSVTSVLACGQVSTPACAPGPLECGTSYSWQVIAMDGHGETATGPLWGFSTQGMPAPRSAEWATNAYSLCRGDPGNGAAILTFADGYSSTYGIAYPAIHSRRPARQSDRLRL